jgi:hypothetical protein
MVVDTGENLNLPLVNLSNDFNPFGKFSVAVTDKTYFWLSEISSPDLVTLPVLIWMAVAPIPVFRLLSLLCLREFVRLPVVFRKEHPPLLVFVVIPVVIILVVPIVDSDLNAGLLGYGAGHN